MEGSLNINLFLIKRLKNLLIWSFIFSLIFFSFSVSKVNPLTLVKGLSDTWNLLKEMFPPDFSKIDRILFLTLETVAIGFWGTLLGILFSLPLGFLSARNIAHGIIYHFARITVNVLRAIPDVMYALIFVMAFGLGPIPGILALSLSTIGLLGKFYSEAVESVDKKPVEALESTGSHKLGVIRHAILPQVFPLFMGYNLYLLDHNIRVALVLGLVGAGGLGLELFNQMRYFNYQKVLAILIVVTLLITLIDRVSATIRKDILEGEPLSDHKKIVYYFLLAFTTIFALSSLFFIPIESKVIKEGLPRIYEFLIGLFPPDLSSFGKYLYLMLETVGMGISGTLLAIILSVPFGFLSARNLIGSKFITRTSSEICNFLRAMPELVFALIFVAAVGLGPFAGVLAIALHTIGFLGKFYAEAIENIDPKPLEAIDSTGASFIQKIRYAVFPQIVPLFNSYNLYLLDRNIRASTVMGVVGAGGIGFELAMSMKVYDYQRTFTIIILIFITITLVDQISSYLRKKVV